MRGGSPWLKRIDIDENEWWDKRRGEKNMMAGDGQPRRAKGVNYIYISYRYGMVDEMK